MTWSDAKMDGAERARIMLETIRASGAPEGCIVRLVDYETEEDYEFLRPGEQWSHGYHKMVMRAAKRLLRKEGFKVDLKVLKMSDYFDWLATSKKDNTPANRAAFVAL